MKLRFVFCFLLIISQAYGADYLTGYLVDNLDGSFDINSPKGMFQIETTDEIKKSLPSLANPTYVKQSDGNPYSYEFKGTLKGDVFTLSQTPTNIPGAESLTGVLRYDLGTDKYFIGEQEVSFGYTKVLNHYEFDEVSRKSFIGKEIIAEGRAENGIFIMQALTPTGLFSAAMPAVSPYEKDLNKKPYKFINKTVYKNEISQSQNSFRKVVYNEKGYTAKPGDSVFLVTLSGRQGDTFGSVNGHFVAGIGEVKKDMTLRAEVSNAYVTNGKDILSGNTSLTNYFSNLVQGQNNYRPTYTFIAYGIDAEKLKKFRDFMEPSHIKFRTEKLDITLQFNCTTETAKGLSLAGIMGNHKRTWYNRAFDLNHLAVPLRVGYLFGEAGHAFGYTASNDKEDFQPRPAFKSYIDSMKNKKFIEKLGIKRMDYVFYSQIPSNRPVGGAPSNHTFNVFVKHDSLYYKKLYDQYENVDDEKKPSHDEFLRLLKKLDHVE